jgi:hypothetical protein
MAVTTTELPRGKDLNELLRHPLSTLQERLGTFESEAKVRLREVLASGNTRLMELDEALARVSKDDWTVPGMRRHLDELRMRAEKVRDSAVKRMQEMPADAVEKIVSGSRGPIQNLARSLAGIARKLEPVEVDKPVKAPVKAPRAAVEPRPEKLEAKA